MTTVVVVIVIIIVVKSSPTLDFAKILRISNFHLLKIANT